MLRAAQPVRGGAREHREPGRRDLGGPWWPATRLVEHGRGVRQQGRGTTQAALTSCPTGCGRRRCWPWPWSVRCTGCSACSPGVSIVTPAWPRPPPPYRAAPFSAPTTGGRCRWGSFVLTHRPGWAIWLGWFDLSPIVLPRPARVASDIVEHAGSYAVPAAHTLATAFIALDIGSFAAAPAVAPSAMSRVISACPRRWSSDSAATPLVVVFPLLARVFGYGPATVRALAAGDGVLPGCSRTRAAGCGYALCMLRSSTPSRGPLGSRLARVGVPGRRAAHGDRPAPRRGISSVVAAVVDAEPLGSSDEALTDHGGDDARCHGEAQAGRHAWHGGRDNDMGEGVLRAAGAEGVDDVAVPGGVDSSPLRGARTPGRTPSPRPGRAPSPVRSRRPGRAAGTPPPAGWPPVRRPPASTGRR